MTLIKKQYDFINSFRGIAILLVLITHSNYVYNSANIAQRKSFHGLVEYGAMGVQLFYMVSAFTLFNSFFIRQQKNDTNIFHFYLRRVFRIAPLFYICMIAMMINISGHYFENFQFFSARITASIIDFKITDIKLWYLTTFTFINGLFPSYLQSPYPGGWSISVEFTFYMILPFLFMVIKTINKSLWLSIFAVIISAGIEMFIFYNPANVFLNSFLVSSLLYQFFFFSLGITAFYYFKNEYKATKFNYIQFAIIVIIPICIFKHAIVLLIGIMFFLLVVSSRNRVNIFNNLIFQYIGKISFSIYLTQWWIIIALSKLPHINDLNWFIVFIITVLLNIGVSSITYHLIEKKFIRLCEKIIKKRSSKPLLST